MKQSIYGLILFVFLALPPVAHLLESIMIIHMHMQMPLLVVAGFLMARYFQLRNPAFFEKWNRNGVPGITLFVVILVYWMIPRMMDESLTSVGVEWFKFFSLPFLAGISLRDSWSKMNLTGKAIVFNSFTLMFIGLGLLYTLAPVQLCNNYLLIEQITLGWGFLTTAICMVIYMLYLIFTHHSEISDLENTTS